MDETRLKRIETDHPNDGYPNEGYLGVPIGIPTVGESFGFIPTNDNPGKCPTIYTSPVTSVFGKKPDGQRSDDITHGVYKRVVIRTKHSVYSLEPK